MIARRPLGRILHAAAVEIDRLAWMEEIFDVVGCVDRWVLVNGMGIQTASRNKADTDAVAIISFLFDTDSCRSVSSWFRPLGKINGILINS